jgi:hypothetical protein
MKAQALAKPKYETIDVPLAQCRGSREAKATNSTVQSVLRKKSCAEVIYYAIPDKKSNVFCRRITLAKVDRSELNLDPDHPDMDDLYDTELPWAGLVSFEGSSRQFRARYALKVFVQVTRMYGDVLYLFAEGGWADLNPPVLLNVEKNNLVASHLKLTIIDDVPKKALDVMIPTKFPKALIDDMRIAGYEWKDDRFVGIDPTRPYSEILCRPYGKFLQPLNGS